MLESAARIVSNLKTRFFQIFIGLILLLLGFIAVSYFFLVEKPSAVTISNLTDHQATFSWVTKSSRNQQIFLRESESDLPKLSFFASNHFELEQTQSEITRIHYFTFKGLKEKTTYYYAIYHFGKKVYQGSFTTYPTHSALNRPHPVYGRVLGEDKKTAIAGALIYFRSYLTPEATNSSTLLSTLTNHEGRWSIDMGNLKKPQDGAPFEFNIRLVEEVVVDIARGKNHRAITSTNRDQPWPDIFLTHE